MHKTDTVRLEKLRDLQGRLKRGEIVQNRQLRTWLGERGYREYVDSCANAVAQRDQLNIKPDELTEYEDLLKKAIILYNRGDSASNRAQHNSARHLHIKAQVAFERALHRLEEMLTADPLLQIWIDRHCDFSPSGTLSLDPVGMPRVITSRSLDNQSKGVSAMVDSKRQSKVRAVNAEIERILNPEPEPDADGIAEKLQTLKAKMRGR